MNYQLAQDDEGFEIADFGAEESGDEEDGQGESNREAQGYDNVSKPAPKPAERPTAPTASAVARDIPRDSVDGETVFAVGEEGDKWSDDEEDDNEHKKLVGKAS